MDELHAQRPAARRSSAANAIVGSLLVLTVAVPVTLSWNFDSKVLDRQGGHATAAVLNRYPVSKGAKLDYVFHAGGSDIVDSLWVPTNSDEFSHPPATLPILYDPANPRNHVVESTLWTPAFARLMVTLVHISPGVPFAAFAIGTELVVRRQMRLARTGIRTMGTVLRLGEEVRVHTHRGVTSREVRLVILYEYFTAVGGRCTGRADAGAAFSPDFGAHWPEIVYDPACPPRHMLFDKMWAVNWLGEA
jgi:hypothetical protein